MESFDTPRRQLLAKITELGGRYGLNPVDYELEVRPAGGPEGPMALAIASGPTDPAKASLFRLMVATMGVSVETGARAGHYPDLNEALDYALRVRDALDEAERPTCRG